MCQSSKPRTCTELPHGLSNTFFLLYYCIKLFRWNKKKKNETASQSRTCLPLVSKNLWPLDSDTPEEKMLTFLHRVPDTPGRCLLDDVAAGKVMSDSEEGVLWIPPQPVMLLYSFFFSEAEARSSPRRPGRGAAGPVISHS